MRNLNHSLQVLACNSLIHINLNCHPEIVPVAHQDIKKKQGTLVFPWRAETTLPVDGGKEQILFFVLSG